MAVVGGLSRAEQQQARRATFQAIRLGNSGSEVAEQYPPMTMRLRVAMAQGSPLKLYATSAEGKDVWAGGLVVTAAIAQKILGIVSADDTAFNPATTRRDDWHAAGDSKTTSSIATADWNIPPIEGRLRLATAIVKDESGKETKVLQDFGGYVLRADHYALAMVAAGHDTSTPGPREAAQARNQGQAIVSLEDLL